MHNFETLIAMPQEMLKKNCYLMEIKNQCLSTDFTHILALWLIFCPSFGLTLRLPLPVSYFSKHLLTVLLMSGGQCLSSTTGQTATALINY